MDTNLNLPHEEGKISLPSIISHLPRWSGAVSINSLNSSINPCTDHAPAAAMFGKYIFAAYKGEGNHNIAMTTFDGSNWAGDNVIECPNSWPQTDDGPALCVFNNTLYMVYRGTGDENDRLWMAWLEDDTKIDGTDWQGDVSVNSLLASGVSEVKTDYHQASLAVFPYQGNDALWVAYQNNSDFYMAVYQNGQFVYNSKVNDMEGDISPESDTNPCISTYYMRSLEQDVLYMTYKGRHSNDLYYAYWDGTTWTGNEEINIPISIPIIHPQQPKTDVCPVTIPRFKGLHMFYKGGGSDTMYKMTLHNQVWRGNFSIATLSTINPETDKSPSGAVYSHLTHHALVLVYKNPDTNQVMVAYHEAESDDENE